MAHISGRKNFHFTLAILKRMLYNTPVPIAGVMELVDVVDSKSTAGDSVPVRVRPPAPRNTAPLWGAVFLYASELAPKVRVRGAIRVLPAADEARGASGRGRCATQAHRRQGAHRAPREGCPYEGGIRWNCPKETPTASGDLITARMVRISSPSAPKTGRESCQRS